uniref:WD repeat domain 63 n=1 Tax=Junco hyemalis TaxID=40217 RepID=A0A8C5IJT4_JUNHY
MSRSAKSSQTTLKDSKSAAKKQKGKTKLRNHEKKKKHILVRYSKNETSSNLGHPEIFPLLLTEKTQEIFNCRPDEDVTEENNFKCIKKEDIIQDLKTRAKSDFLPFKKVILEYPGEELLVVFDPSSQYGQNFYIVASEEAKENFLKSLEAAEEKEETEEENIEEAPEPRKPWVSLGSEKEVEEESLIERETKIKYKISRVRRQFGAPITFTDKNAADDKESYAECTAYEDNTFSIKLLERDVGVQMVPKLREATTQTKWTYPKNASTQYYPRQLSNEAKAESLSSGRLKKFLTAVCLRVEIALQQNEIMNVFFDDWKALAEDQEEGKPDVYFTEYQTFTDVQYLKNRTISCVRWHPTIYGIIALSAREQPSYEEQVNPSNKSLLQSVILLWSIFDPSCLQLVLKAPEDIYCFQFSPSNPNFIAGGCVDGQVFQSLKIKLHISVCSSSIKMRHLLDFLTLQDGEVVYSEWKKKIDANTAKLHSQKYSLHTETINTLQKSPFFKDIFLSIGGQRFAIWKEGVTNGPILQSSCSAGRYTAGQWSLTRPGVFFLGRDNGSIDIWDLLKKTHEPSHFQNISKSIITCISPSIASEQHFLAVSDNLGVLHILEICQTLCQPPSNEHAKVLDYFKREVKYLKHCEEEFEEYQKFQAKTEMKLSWRQRDRKQYVTFGIKMFYISFYL